MAWTFRRCFTESPRRDIAIQRRVTGDAFAMLGFISWELELLLEQYGIARDSQSGIKSRVRPRVQEAQPYVGSIPHQL